MIRLGCGKPSRERDAAALITRLNVDFFGRENPSPTNNIEPSVTSSRDFFFSRPFRLQVARWLCRSLLSRELADTDTDILERVDDPSKDIIHLAFVLLDSAEYFDEQAGGNFAFFRRRLGELFQAGSRFETEPSFIGETDRSAFVSRVLGNERVLEYLAGSIYDAFGIKQTKPQLREILQRTSRAFFIEEVLSAAVQEETYIRDAANAHSSLDLARFRLTEILEGFIDTERAWERKKAQAVAADLLGCPQSYYIAAGLIGEFIREARRARQDDRFLVGNALGEAAAACPDRLYLTDLVEAAGNAVRSAATTLEASYVQVASTFAEKIVRHWNKLCTPFHPLDEEGLRLWTERLVLADGIVEVLSEFILSDAGLGAIVRLVFPRNEISQMPGPFIRSSYRGPDLRRIVTTTFFYWYDNTDPDGRAFIACPHSFKNEEGEDSLTVSPDDQENFSFRSYHWHRTQLADMQEAHINVVMPVSYNYPFSWEPTTADGPPDYLAFADAGLRVFRRAWFDLADEDTTVPAVAMFYDTSTLHKCNRFGLQVDFRRRYGKAWFYESIRNFFSHIPRKMWAFYEGRPIVFVYHPSFGLAVDESLYPYVRDRFFNDFGLDLYIVTAAEEEAPRVINADLLAADTKALQANKRGVEVLAKTLADEDHYLSAGSNDAVYAATIIRRLFSSSDSKELIARHMHGTLGDKQERFDFVMRLLTSEEFAWRMVDRWFRQLLRRSFNARDPDDRRLANDVSRRLVADGDWLGALIAIASSDAYYSAAGGDDNYLVDWIYQSILMKHPNGLCTPGYHQLWANPAEKTALLADLRTNPRQQVLRKFLSRYEACEAIVSRWRFDFSGWYNPGPADSSFYWSAAISPMIRGVASIGPGYDQSKCRPRAALCMPRQDGKTYQDVWTWLLAMEPRPSIVHIETWNEFFEGTPICRSKEFGHQYIALTRQYAKQFLDG